MPAEPTPLPDLPLWELVQTYFPVARGFHAVFDAVGLSATQFGVLVALGEDGGGDLSQADLARRVLVRPQSMGELIAGLTERGLVVREGPGGRGRRSQLHLTAAGRDALAHAVPAVNAYNDPSAIGLSPAEAHTLTRLLRAVRASLTAGEGP